MNQTKDPAHAPAPDIYVQALQAIHDFRHHASQHPIHKNQLIGLITHIPFDHSYINDRRNRIIRAIQRGQIDRIEPLLSQLEAQIKAMRHIADQTAQYLQK